MKKYYVGYIALPFEVETEKAVAFTVSHGHIGRGHDTPLWLPKSQLEIGEPNEVNIAEIKIPAWLLDKNNVNFYKINEVRTGNGEDTEIWK